MEAAGENDSNIEAGRHGLAGAINFSLFSREKQPFRRRRPAWDSSANFDATIALTTYKEERYVLSSAS